MTREEVYDKCTERYGIGDEVIYAARFLLPPEAIDAIIDCAVEEAVKAVKERKE